MAEFVDFARFEIFYMVHDGSLFHKFLCFVTMSPLWILTYLVSVLLIYNKKQRRNILLLVALVSSIAFNKILKRLIRHPRPYHHIYHGHGMPSDHAQFTCLWAGYLHQLLCHHQRFNWSKFYQRKHKLYVALIWMWALLVCYSRHALLFHDAYQLTAGGLIGIALSIIWYKIDELLIVDNANGGAYLPFSLEID